MKLLVISSKECWRDSASPSGFSTIGGFPFQMHSLSQLFERTELLIALKRGRPPSGIQPLVGNNLVVRPLPEPKGKGVGRKLLLVLWFLRYLPNIWARMGRSDAVHALVPGDIGTLGILITLLRQKRLFVRHCGTWGEPITISDRFLLWLLQRIASKRNIVLATGGNCQPPSPANRSISWIFSTTLTEKELEILPDPVPWRVTEPLRLITVGRLSLGKNIVASIRAVSRVRETYPLTTLQIVGDGPQRRELEKLVADLNLREAVTFHGNVPHSEVLRVLGTCHLFLFPTEVKEGFPKALIEALACGLPAIATDISVVPLLLGRDTGILLQRTDHNSLANAILELTAQHEDFASLSDAARKMGRTYSLERWQDVIRERLTASWVEWKKP